MTMTTLSRVIRDIYLPRMTEIAGHEVQLVDERETNGDYVWTFRAGDRVEDLSITDQLLKSVNMSLDSGRFVRALASELRRVASDLKAVN